MNLTLYTLTLALLVISFFKDKKKTRMALKKSWVSLSNILPQFLAIIVLVGLLLSIFDADLISNLVGRDSGWMGTLLSACIGALTLIPGFIAFPTADILIKEGAGYAQVAAFISALMMVGVVTFPVEARYFGKRLTLVRNLIAFVFCFIVAALMGAAMGVPT